MRDPVEIENIEALRRQEGIEDVELGEAIRGLRVGDFVQLTLLAGLKSSETLPVRITRIRGSVFRGKLAKKPACSALAKLQAGAPLAFTTAHIHSLPKGRPAHDQ